MKVIRRLHERRDRMDCKSFELNRSSYVDGYLTDEEKELFKQHLDECPCCKSEYDNLKIMIDSVNEIEEIPLPKDFSVELAKKLREEASPKRKFISSRVKVLGGIAAALLIVVTSASLLNNSFLNRFSASEMAPAESPQMKMDYADNKEKSTAFNLRNAGGVTEERSIDSAEDMDLYAAEETAELAEITMVSVESSRKIIQRGHITIEVENFDEVHQNVLSLVEESNGFVQDSEIYYYFQNREKPEESLKNANMELRIPSDDFTGVFEHLKKLGVPTEENTSGENITENYMDIDNQVENLSIQEQRLREILQKADRVEDLLQVENELNRVRTQINQLTGVLKTYDGLVSMATINLNIRQVAKEVLHVKTINDNLWNKARNNFVYSINRLVKILERAVIGFFGLLPFMIPLLIMTGILGYFIYKKRKTG